MQINALVVDDSAVMRKMVMRALNESRLAEFRFLESADGLEALKQFKSNKVDVAFVDWNMPNMNGIDLVNQIRSKEKHHVPIVMVTTEGTMGKVEEALDQAGVDSYIVKPFTTDMLKKKLGPLFQKLLESKVGHKGFFSRLASRTG